MPDIIELYELFLQIIEPKRYSQSSIKTYKSILMPFLPHVNGEDMEKLSENDIWDWMLKKLKVRGFPYASVKAYATTIRLFCREFFRRTIKLDFVRRARKSEKLPVVLSMMVFYMISV